MSDKTIDKLTQDQATERLAGVRYTPGPWEVVFEGHRLSVWAEGYGFVHTHEVPQVNMGATKTANANARLIAAAPELLSMLKTWVEAEADAHFEEQAHDADGCRYCESVAVIARAEGRP
jgi:hypothetical protein